MADPRGEGARGARSAARAWAHADLRRRWPSLVALGLLAGLTAGAAAAAFAGARRTDTALARLRAATHASDAIVFASQVEALHPDWSLLAGDPEVRRVAVWDLLFGNVNDEPGAVLFASKDGTFLGAVDRPVVVQGRRYNPGAADEVVVDENAQRDVPLGRTFAFQPFAVDQNDESGDPPAGPKVTMHVVGVVREVNEFLFVPDGQVFVSPAFIARYGAQVDTAENAAVELAHAPADMPALQRDVDAHVAAGAPILDLHAARRRVDTTLSVERSGLLALALAIALAGGFLVAQALVRSAAVVGDDVVVLRAIGMTRGDVALAGGLPHALTAAVGVIAALATAVLAAFRVALGRAVDPDVGFHADWTVLGPVLLLMAALVFGTSLLVARRAEGLREGRSGYPSRLAGWIRPRMPVTVGFGAGMAFERGRGAASVPVRPVLIGAVVGVTGIVATLSINQGIRDALAHPERAGVTWNVGARVVLGELTARGMSPASVAAIVGASGPGAALAVVDRSVLAVGGIGAPTFSLRALDGSAGTPISLAVTSGRAPAQPGEAAIGPATAAAVHARIGDTVPLADGPPVRIVGEALFPPDVHAEFDQGLWVTPERYDEAVPARGEPGAPAFVDRMVAVRLPPGGDTGAAIGKLQGALGDRASDVSAPELPIELTNLRNVRRLPAMLAGFLALVAVGAISHQLVTTTRRRRRDFAILRALGLGRGGTRLVLNAQGTAIGIFGLVLGLPLGVAVGRTGWRLVAERVPLAVVAPLALLAVLVLIPATVAVVNLLALWPGRRVAGRRLPAEVLRAE